MFGNEKQTQGEFKKGLNKVTKNQIPSKMPVI